MQLNELLKKYFRINARIKANKSIIDEAKHIFTIPHQNKNFENEIIFGCDPDKYIYELIDPIISYECENKLKYQHYIEIEESGNELCDIENLNSSINGISKYNIYPDKPIKEQLVEIKEKEKLKIRNILNNKQNNSFSFIHKIFAMVDNKLIEQSIKIAHLKLILEEYEEGFNIISRINLSYCKEIANYLRIYMNKEIEDYKISDKMNSLSYLRYIMFIIQYFKENINYSQEYYLIRFFDGSQFPLSRAIISYEESKLNLKLNCPIKYLLCLYESYYLCCNIEKFDMAFIFIKRIKEFLYKEKGINGYLKSDNNLVGRIDLLYNEALNMSIPFSHINIKNNLLKHFKIDGKEYLYRGCDKMRELLITDEINKQENLIINLNALSKIRNIYYDNNLKKIILNGEEIEIKDLLFDGFCVTNNNQKESIKFKAKDLELTLLIPKNTIEIVLNSLVIREIILEYNRCIKVKENSKFVYIESKNEYSIFMHETVIFPLRIKQICCDDYQIKINDVVQNKNNDENYNIRMVYHTPGSYCVRIVVYDKTTSWHKNIAVRVNKGIEINHKTFWDLVCLSIKNESVHKFIIKKIDILNKNLKLKHINYCEDNKIYERVIRENDANKKLLQNCVIKPHTQVFLEIRVDNTENTKERWFTNNMVRYFNSEPSVVCQHTPERQMFLQSNIISGADKYFPEYFNFELPIKFLIYEFETYEIHEFNYQGIFFERVGDLVNWNEFLTFADHALVEREKFRNQMLKIQYSRQPVIILDKAGDTKAFVYNSSFYRSIYGEYDGIPFEVYPNSVFKVKECDTIKLNERYKIIELISDIIYDM
ncbi:hypothetical protein TCON_0815 [Astathelohania contejeani]|uniref:Uncharacterized protein n=1 Tax=Astathelohania contejeani TaxID=164912 RepID=A0ABQ7I0J5_9MICR|nr:hypothetical protein TCON_0815 [Thelohania contejeani]